LAMELRGLGVITNVQKLSQLHLGEWAIALHGKDTHPLMKVINDDVNH
jgi:hypothetical protein